MISVTVEQDHATVALVGEHESYSADKLARQVGALIEERVHVVVDLTQATFIDSTVVGVLLAQSRRAGESDVPFSLLLGEETGWPVRRLLEVTGLESQLHVVQR
jgi:anti-sigma B factor antagonist